MNIRIGRISKTLSPGYGTCGRCDTTWFFVKEHITLFSECEGMFALCEKCWSELTPETRMPFYRELWSEWTDRRSRWEDVETAVLDGK